MKREDGKTAIIHLIVTGVNMFNKNAFIYPFRWFIMVALCLLSTLVYTDVSGYKLFNTTKDEKLTAGAHANHIYHK